MWCPEGYITLGEIISQLIWDIDQFPIAEGKPLVLQQGQPLPDNLEPDEGEVDAFIKWCCATLFRLFENDFRVCLPTGALVRVIPSVLLRVQSGWLEMPPTITKFPNNYEDRLEIAKWEVPVVDLEWGTVRENPQFPSLNPIVGAPLCLGEAVLPVVVPKLTTWLLEKSEELGAPYKSKDKQKWVAQEVADQIVQAYLSGKVRDRNEAQKLFGTGLNTDAWKALWKMATNLDSRLSRPGRRRR